MRVGTLVRCMARPDKLGIITEWREIYHCRPHILWFNGSLGYIHEKCIQEVICK